MEGKNLETRVAILESKMSNNQEDHREIKALLKEYHKEISERYVTKEEFNGLKKDTLDNSKTIKTLISGVVTAIIGILAQAIFFIFNLISK